MIRPPKLSDGDRGPQTLGVRRGYRQHTWEVALPDGTTHTVIFQPKLVGRSIVAVDGVVVAEPAGFSLFDPERRIVFNIGEPTNQAYISGRDGYRLFVDGHLIQ